ncbi:MAG TPA: hypothetical protein VG326_11405 [Tepidisphaeraceae bacterium]|nr:hypothetical protein [Tepidisphaeraceae bacterium]
MNIDPKRPVGITPAIAIPQTRPSYRSRNWETKVIVVPDKVTLFYSKTRKGGGVDIALNQRIMRLTKERGKVDDPLRGVVEDQVQLEIAGVFGALDENTASSERVI